MHSLRVSAKIIIGFLFSITILLTFFTLSLFGVQADDGVRLIITEATGLQRDMIVFQANLQPMVIHNVFWLCLASFGFMLIFLYFIDHNFKVFLPPGLLCLIFTIVLVVMVAVSRDSIINFTGPSTDLYLQTALDRFRQAAIGMTIFGILLTAVALWGDQFLKKSKQKLKD
ncbi:MAG: hypothetical protein ACQESO_00245 [Bacillota bacterium]